MSRRRLCIALSLACSVAWGQAWYVDNRTGSDANDGKSAGAAFATIARATAAAKASDTIVLANSGVAYREAIRLRGLGGTPSKPLVIEGNGATITGLKPLKAADWTPRGDGLYSHAVAKKPYGVPFLVHRGRRVPRAASAAAVGPGQFAWDDKGITFRPEPGKAIGACELEATLVVSGLEISGASYITCRNLVSEYHSNDGFNVHGECRGIVCENVVGRHNGDDGFSVHETIGAVVRNGHFHHNRWGIQDVNASRSAFNGVTCEHNEINGADFVGGYHSLVDCIVRHNGRAQINVRGERPRHLLGSEHNPLCDAIVFLKNVVAVGGTAGLFVGPRSRVTAEHCLFTGAETGVAVRDGGICHLTASIIAACTTLELDSTARTFFRDHNLYHPGRFRWLGKDFSPKQWDAFRKAAAHDRASLLTDPKLSPAGSRAPTPAAPRPSAGKRVGPTDAVVGDAAPAR